MGGSEHDPNHRVGTQRTIKGIELLTAKRLNGRGQAQIIAGSGWPLDQSGRIKVRTMLADECSDRVREAGLRRAHDFDRKFTRKGQQIWRADRLRGPVGSIARLHACVLAR